MRGTPAGYERGGYLPGMGERDTCRVWKRCTSLGIYHPPYHGVHSPTLGIPQSSPGRLTVLVNGAAMTGMRRRVPGLYSLINMDNEAHSGPPSH